MAARTRFDLDVTADLRNLDDYIRDLENDLWKVTQVAGHNVQRRSKEIAVAKGVFDTGTLVNTIMLFDANRREISIRVGATQTYAPAQEFGTAFLAGRPYMVPALEAEKRPYIQAITQMVKRGES